MVRRSVRVFDLLEGLTDDAHRLGDDEAVERYRRALNQVGAAADLFQGYLRGGPR